MPSTIRSRVAFLAVGVVVLTLAIAARLIHLQVISHQTLRARAERQHHQLIELGGQRGAVLDRQGRELAVSVSTRSLYVHPRRLRDPARNALLLAPVLGLRASEIERTLRSDRSFEWIARRLDPRAVKAIEALASAGLELGRDKPIYFEDEPKRFYPQGSLAAQVVGYANVDQRGVEGIEKQFDDALQGAPSKYLALRDGTGVGILQLVEPPKKLAVDVVLSIDVVLQHLLERELDRALADTGAVAATAVLLDPQTGDVLAMASRPVPDPAHYGAAPVEARRIRAVTDLYEPGSTFKVFTAAAAIERGTISPEQRFNCASLSIAGKDFRDVHAHNVLSTREILEKSSNIGAIRIGLTMPREVLREHVVQFGFGRRTGIELPGERNGRITSLANMSALSPASMAMGYEVGVTALQVVSAIGAIANEGKLVPPRIVAGFRDAAGTFTPVARPEARQVISRRTAVTVANMLEGVIVRGTGKGAAVPGYHIGGKTGTTKKVRPGGGYSERDYFSSFAAFGPLRDPRLAGILVLDTPSGSIYYGGLTAAPALGRVFADALGYLGVEPNEDPWKAIAEARARVDQAREKAKRERSLRQPRRPEAAETEAPQVALGPGLAPDLHGATLRAAAAALTARGCVTRAQGRGVVVGQVPLPGAVLEAGMTCVLTLGVPDEPGTASVAELAPSTVKAKPAKKPARRSAAKRTRRVA